MITWMRVGEAVATEDMTKRLEIERASVADRTYIQAARPAGFVQGRAIYVTFHKLQDQWYYAGHCYRGETKQALAEKGEVVS